MEVVRGLTIRARRRVGDEVAALQGLVDEPQTVFVKMGDHALEVALDLMIHRAPAGVGHPAISMRYESDKLA
ncbi:MAG: hypothetical protein WA751_06735 [Candidatus Dormiibacterota bacterium]